MKWRAKKQIEPAKRTPYERLWRVGCCIDGAREMET